MSELIIKVVPSPDDRDLPIFEELDQVSDQIRVRAYSLFADRGFSVGHELDDWLTAQREICWPAAELIEEDDEYRARIALAGFDADEIDLTATPREIIVKATCESGQGNMEPHDDATVRWSEFSSNAVYRQIAFPSDVEVDAIRARFENGMLEIEAPKAFIDAATGAAINETIDETIDERFDDRIQEARGG